MTDTTTDYHDEARRLLDMIEKSGVWPGGAQFTAKDMSFVRSLKIDPTRPVSQRMIFWLRDIKERCEL